MTEALLDRLPCPTPPLPPSGTAEQKQSPDVEFSPWDASSTPTPAESAADPWRVGPCSLALQREILRDLRYLVTSMARLPSRYFDTTAPPDRSSSEHRSGLMCVIAAVAVCMADACARIDPTTLPALPGLATPAAAPAAGSGATSLLADVLNGVATWRALPAGEKSRPLGFSLSAFDCAVPFTKLLTAHELAHPRLLRARAAALRYERGSAAAAGAGAPVPFTWAGCSIGIAVNDSMLDVVRALVHLTWRRFEPAPPFAAVPRGRFDSSYDDIFVVDGGGGNALESDAGAAYKRAIATLPPGIARRHELAAWLVDDSSWEDLPELLALRDLSLFLRAAAASQTGTLGLPYSSGLASFSIVFGKPLSPRLMVPLVVRWVLYRRARAYRSYLSPPHTSSSSTKRTTSRLSTTTASCRRFSNSSRALSSVGLPRSPRRPRDRRDKLRLERVRW